MADKSKPVYKGTRSKTNGNGSAAGVNSLATVPTSPGNSATTVTTAASDVQQFFHGPTLNMVNRFAKPGSYDLNVKYAEGHGGQFTTGGHFSVGTNGSAPANLGGSPRPQ